MKKTVKVKGYLTRQGHLSIHLRNISVLKRKMKTGEYIPCTVTYEIPTPKEKN